MNRYKLLVGAFGIALLALNFFKSRQILGISGQEIQGSEDAIMKYREDTGDYSSGEIEAYIKMCVKAYRESHNDYTTNDEKIWRKLRRR